MPNAASETIVIQRLHRLERSLRWNSKRREITRHLHNLMALVDLYQLEEVRREFDDRIRRAGPDSRYKYLDAPLYILQNLLLAYELGLDKGMSRSILDIGTGGAYFPLVCRYFGHQVVGIDIVNPVYDRIAQCLGVAREIVSVQPGKPLPPSSDRFDLITACTITFDEIRTQDRQKHRLYWSLDEWQFFLEDLMTNQLRYPGRLYLKLNKHWRGRFLGLNRFSFDRRLMAALSRNGATVSYLRGTIDMSLTGPRALSWPAS
jgi:SAM-dependent methyltransferase